MALVWFVLLDVAAAGILKKIFGVEVVLCVVEEVSYFRYVNDTVLGGAATRRDT